MYFTVKKIFSILLVLLLIASCIKRQDPEYNIDVKSHWYKSQDNKIIKTNYLDKRYRRYWWRKFNDDVLNYLVQSAIQNNPDFKIAHLRIKEARANKVKAKAVLSPEVYATGHTTISSQNLPAGMTTNQDAVITSTPSLNASWETDFFGANKNINTAKQHKLFAIISEKNYFLATLIADVITNYIEYRKYQKLLSINERNLKSQIEILGMVQAKHKSGLESDFEVRQARSVYLTTKAQSHKLNYQKLQSQYRIETLCGAAIGFLGNALKRGRFIPQIKAPIVANSPLYVIQNRPDIIQAEEELLEATALTKSAIASQFPKSTLSVMLGAQSSNFLPSQVIWEIGSAVTAPLINFDRIKSEINVKEAKEEQAFLNYQKVVSKALEEVEVNFGRYISYHNHHLELEKLVQNNKKALSLSKHLYESSTIPYIDVLEAEKDVYNAEILKTESLAEFSKTSVALHKALGYCI